MIPVKSSMTQVDELPGEEREFSIGDPRWVMKTQADLYSNRELAVAREYSTNAFDANAERAAREGREPVAIEVTLPSMMHPYFTVKDSGDGMGKDTLLNVYTSFGLSTKRDSEISNGLLGYGCKSAVAYTTSFTVTSVHKGIKTIAVITRRPDWSIVMKIVSEQKSDEPSGTEVTVPVSDWQKFRHIAEDFYRFWLPGRVKVDGVEPKQDVGAKITEGLYYSTHWAQSYVVMSNVPYRINNPEAMFRNSKMSRINFVAYVDTVLDADGNKVAAVEFTPSREDLKYTDHTINTLQQVIANFEKQIVDAATNEIDKATTHAEAYKAWKKWTDTLGQRMFADLTFKGDKFQSSFAVRGTRYDASAYPQTVQVREWHVDQMERTMFVTECDVQVSSSVKNKGKDYAIQENWPHKFIIYTPDSKQNINSKWITKDHFVTWEDLKAALPKATRTHHASGKPRRVKGTFDFFTLNGRKYEQPLPDDTTDVFWITVREYKRWDYSLPNILRILKPKATVVILPQNRLAKFKRENPDVQNVLDYARTKVVIDGETLLSDEAKRALAVSSDTTQWADRLDLNKVDDPMFAESLRLVANKDALTREYYRNITLASLLNMRYNVKEYRATTTTESASIKYPLLGALTHRATEPHLYLYLNAAYAAEKK